MPDESNSSGPELFESHQATVGRFSVARSLPVVGRRMIGAWCFADHFGPADVSPESGLDVGPHPHTGLQTVTWITSGQVLHRDSLGSEQVIRPGEVNLMTAGQGITHAEEATGHYAGMLEGVQLWIAQTDATRHGEARFEHRDTLPRIAFSSFEGTVFAGAFEGQATGTTHDTPLVGLDAHVHGEAAVPLDPTFEYGVISLAGDLEIESRSVSTGTLAYLRPGRDEVTLRSSGAHVLLLGGQPFDEKILMWWNFVGRSADELDAAASQWTAQDDRFGRLTSDLPAFDAPEPYWRRGARPVTR